jgi:uncharacterized protein with HEPN domain
MKRLAKPYIADILENIATMEEMIAGFEYESFVSNTEKKYAVVRCIEIVGEAVKSVPEELKLKHPQIPWKRMAGMRDKLIHAYRGVDYRLVWVVATVDLPALVPHLRRIHDGVED